jgi:hypothetical protein
LVDLDNTVRDKAFKHLARYTRVILDLKDAKLADIVPVDTDINNSIDIELKHYKLFGWATAIPTIRNFRIPAFFVRLETFISFNY